MLLNKHIKIALFLLLLTSCSHEDFESLQNSNNPFTLTTEGSLLDNNIIEKIDSIYNIGEEGFFTGEQDIKIYYKYFLQKESSEEKGAIVISNGRTEAALKYKETIYDLYNNGYSIYINDHRGQGLSDRMIDNRDMGYVDEFQNYVKDLKYFYESFIKTNNHENYYLLAHSMGGAIGMLYLEEYPNDFKAAAFSSPMLGLSCPTCLLIGILTGDEPEYAMGNTDYDNGVEPFLENTLTNSEIRYNRTLKVFDENKEARLGGSTYQWVSKSCDAFDVIFENHIKIKTPIILFSGEEEVIVDPSAHNKFIELLNENGKDAKGYYVEKAKHELFVERDEVRIPVITTILKFYNSNK